MISKNLCGLGDFILNGRNPKQNVAAIRVLIPSRRLDINFVSRFPDALFKHARTHTPRPHTHIYIYHIVCVCVSKRVNCIELSANEYASCMSLFGDTVCTLSTICVAILTKNNRSNCFPHIWYFHDVWWIDSTSFGWHTSPENNTGLFACLPRSCFISQLSDILCREDISITVNCISACLYCFHVLLACLCYFCILFMHPIST